MGFFGGRETRQPGCRPARARRAAALAVILLSALLAGCGAAGSGAGHRDEGARGAAGQAAGETGAARPLTRAEIAALRPPGPAPRWVSDPRVPDLPALYQWAREHRYELQYIPCYCGCGNEPFGHRSNADCYFRVEGQQLVWEPHGAG